MSLDKKQKSALFIILLYALLGPFVGTILTILLTMKFDLVIFFFGYAFGSLVAAVAGGVSSVLVDSFNNSGKEWSFLTGIIQGTISGIITTIIFCIFLVVFYGVPRDWENKFLWFSSVCVFSAMICGMVINNILIEEKKSHNK